MQDIFNKLARTAARLLPIAALALTSFSAAHATTLAVPAGYPTIQTAVNASQNGDTVLIADGTYTGDGNRDIDFGGKNITVTSQNGSAKTIIDCGGYASTDGSGNHRGFYIHSGETNAVISGLTVKNGYESSDNGGGVYGGTLTNCLITGNFSESNGGGVYGGTLTNCLITGNFSESNGGGVYGGGLTNCTISNNTAGGNGGGVSNGPLTGCTISGNKASLYGGGVNGGTLTNCLIIGNTADRGGGVYVATMTNCTVTGNTATSGGGYYGGYYFARYALLITNCIFYGDSGGEIYALVNGPGLVYCDVQGGYPGPVGNINSDPQFVNAVGGDFHLEPSSPCLSKGTSGDDVGVDSVPTTDKDGNLRPNPPSIGAYEGEPAAPNAATHLLWTNPDGAVMVWNVDTAGQFTIAGVYGPYTDGPGTSNWTATALATGPDGLSHILWNNPDGRVILWAVDGAGKFTITGVYGPYTDAPNSPSSVWKATALSVGPDNIPHILWTNPDGKAILWNVAGDGTFVIASVYGPYNDGPGTANWTATALATGPDGLSHLLWTNSDGHTAFWTLDGQGGFTPFFYGPYNDGAPNTPWTATAVSVGPDNVPHLLWTNTDGKALMWNVKADGTFTIPGVYGPYTDGAPANLWRATSLATGEGGLSHLLWNNPDGRVALWTVSSDGTFTVIGGYGPYYGPYNDGSPGMPWTAVAVSANP